MGVQIANETLSLTLHEFPPDARVFVGLAGDRGLHTGDAGGARVRIEMADASPARLSVAFSVVG